jgi:hypothetical protein
MDEKTGAAYACCKVDKPFHDDRYIASGISKELFDLSQRGKSLCGL